MKSLTFNRLAAAVVISAVALTGVSTPVMAQDGGNKARAAARAEKAQKNTATPRTVKVDRGVNRAPKTRVDNAEPVPARRSQPRVDTVRPVDRSSSTKPAQNRTPKPAQRIDRTPNDNGTVVQRADKPIKVRKPARVITTDDNVVVRNPRNANPTVRPSDPVRPVKVQPNNRDYRAARVSEQVQRTRINENRSRISNYNQYLIRQQRSADQRRRELELQRRLAQARYMQDYWRRLAIQQQRVNSWQSYNYNNDPYFYTPASYRYGYGGNYYETNQYGRNLLEQAVNEGYREGYYAGRADRDDRWRYGYQDSFAYQDANCGYNGMYVSQSNYNYYFRQGFERGYEDGYYSRSNYGHHTGTTIAILAGVLGTILVLDAIND